MNYIFSVEIDSLFEGIDFYASITRARFEEIVCNVLNRSTIDPFEKAISNTAMDNSQIQGGSVLDRYKYSIGINFIPFKFTNY